MEQRTIVVASEDAGVGEMIAHLLELRGHVVRMAHDPEQMREAVSADRPSVVVVEAMLPSARWARAVQEMQRALGQTCPPVVMLAGSWFDEQEIDLSDSVETVIAENRGDELIALVERYCMPLRKSQPPRP